MLTLRRSGAAAARVLVLDGDPSGLPLPIGVLLGAHLERSAVPIDVDLLHRPAAALRVQIDTVGALDSYSAVIAMTGSSKQSSPVERASRQLAANIPTLLIRVSSNADASPEAHAFDRGHTSAGEPKVVTLAPAEDITSAVQQFKAGLYTLLMAAEPDAASNVPPLRARALSSIVLNRLGHITQLAAGAFHLRAAKINLRDGRDLVTISAAGAPLKRHPFHDSLCAIAPTKDGITVISDTRRDSQAGRVSATEGADRIRFYAGANDSFGRLESLSRRRVPTASVVTGWESGVGSSGERTHQVSRFVSGAKGRESSLRLHLMLLSLISAKAGLGG